MLDVRVAGEYLGVSAWSVCELVWQGDLVAMQLGRLVRLLVLNTPSVGTPKLRVENQSGLARARGGY